MSRDLPPHAVSVFYANDEIVAQFVLPHSGNTAEISFRNNPQGLAALSRFLRERATAFAKARPALFGTPAAPIQHIVDSWQRDPAAEAKAARAAERAEAERFKAKPVKEQLNQLSNMLDSFDF